MELIGVLDQRRLRRELRRREAALQEAARASSPNAVQAPEVVEPRPKPDQPTITESTPEWLVAPYSSATQTSCECDFCGRRFHGYGQFLNHNCHDAA